jgi:hypothetical protein
MRSTGHKSTLIVPTDCSGTAFDRRFLYFLRFAVCLVYDRPALAVLIVRSYAIDVAITIHLPPNTPNTSVVFRAFGDGRIGAFLVLVVARTNCFAREHQESHGY